VLMNEADFWELVVHASLMYIRVLVMGNTKCTVFLVHVL
jgi:hypothetical protein